MRFNRVSEKVPVVKVPEKVWEGFGAKRSQGQQGSGEGSGEGLGGFGAEPGQVNRIFGHSTHGNPAVVFPALGFAARFKKICKNIMSRLLGIPPKLINKIGFRSGPY